MLFKAFCNRQSPVLILDSAISWLRQTKTLRVMQLTAILLTICSLTVTARSMSQSITFSGKDITLDKVFSSIKKQTGYYIFYKKNLLAQAKPVTIEANNLPLNDFLAQVFNNQPLIYAIHNTSITVESKALDVDLNSTPAFPSFVAPPVTGIVRGPDGQPIAGANVIIKNTKRGTTTNFDGTFSIEANRGEELIISSIGYIDFKIKIADNYNIGVAIMSISESKLDEVQIIAYGSVTKKYNTSNMGTVNAEDIAKQPVSNPLLTLQAKVPGLFIAQTTGQTVGNVNVNVQGINSIGNGSEPFYVIDGVPFTPQFTNYSLLGTNLVGVGGSSFNFINPSDIESISILKDADATAIYGSRAANGAILITTKKGKAGKTKAVDINLRNGWGKVDHKLDFLNTQQYLEMRKEAYTNAGQPIPNSSDDPNDSNFDLTLWDQNRYTDWQKLLVGGTAQFTDIQASISGGSENTQFMASYGYNKQTTVFPNSLADIKGNVHFSLNHRSRDNKFTYAMSATYLQDKNQLNASDLMDDATKLAPNAPALFNADGSLSWGQYSANPDKYSFYNPLATTKNTYTGKTGNLTASNTISYELFTGLQLKAAMGFNHLSANETQINPITAKRPDAYSRTRSANYINKFITTWSIEPQLTYSKETKYGVINALLGTSFQQITSDVLSQTGSGYSNDEQLQNLSAASSVTINMVDKLLYKYNALFGRINYLLNKKYILNITARTDGSSRFGNENKFHNFYAVGGAWIFGDEEKMQKYRSWLSLGKLRLSYGTTGNDQISDYRYLSLLNTFNVDIPYQQSVGLVQTGLTNPFIQWEETRKLNLGLDLGFIKDRILLTVNIYRNRSSNQLIGYQLPSITGFGSVDQNFPATVQNTGLELQLNLTPVKSKTFTWQSSFNISRQKNQLVAFPDLATSSYSNQYFIGKPINVKKVYRYAGVNTTTGYYEFYNAKGEKTSTPSYSDDRTVLVDPNPNFFGGFSNNFQYKGFELDLFFQFVNRKGMDSRFGNIPGLAIGNQPVSIIDRWKKEGDQKNIEKATTDFQIFSPYYAAITSDAVYSNASFIRLKNASLSYTLPSQWLSHNKASYMRIYVQGQNLLTITNFVGSDPETMVLGVLPPLRVFAFGLQFGF
jgi:TonB-dependent starch-binding outer membrane protein SusC